MTCSRDRLCVTLAWSTALEFSANGEYQIAQSPKCDSGNTCGGFIPGVECEGRPG